MLTDVPGVQVTRSAEHADAVLTPEALGFVAQLHRSFDRRRQRLLGERQERQARFDAGELPDFLPNTHEVRSDPDWHVASAPADLDDRRVEITGPVEPKMMINALNSGARVFMARLRGRPLANLAERGDRPMGGGGGRPPAAHVPDR